MKRTEKLTREQLNQKVKKTSERLYATIDESLELMFTSGDDWDQDSLSEFLEMMDAETADKMRETALQMDTDNDDPEIFIMKNESVTSLNLVTEPADGFIIILIEDDIHLTGNLFIEEYVTLIVTGHIKAKNIIVNGSLFSSGSLSCNVLFGASANDHQTYIQGNINTSLIAEDGHYTVSEGKIYSQYLLSTHNTIEGKSGRLIENKALERGNEASVLIPEILDENGYFDEVSFLKYIEIKEPEYLFL
ncbi:hypothetical protein [Chryseobacterium herbae]|uniref:Polymer-forming cytoskeletal protein n=1 Tax=Chryseobacterium herbae TaxID=2976476 RepID=A0ABT2J0S5_9FLAO|nr:hypothetical protein [Chryseobacterium sp. pc1-10]MCT2564326.1 hypothetical protein [Chryseobacterium sp. pc1-10]